MIASVHHIQAWQKSFLFLLTAAATLIANHAFADTVTLTGSTTLNATIIAPHQHQIERATGHKLNVVPNKTTPGLIDLLQHKGDLAMLSTPFEAAVAFARQVFPELPYHHLRSFKIAETRVALAVHPSNPVRAMSREMLQRVLRGQVDNWQELGGNDTPIRLVMVRDGGGVRLTVENEVLGGGQVTARDPILVPNGARIVKIVEQEPGVLALSQLNLVKRFNLPELVLDKPIRQELNLVSLGEPTPAVKEVIEATKRIAALNGE
jgi:ABC-type phosphate transport system substrate-binding protein